MNPEVLILDVDGVMTDGGFYYTEAGKVMKRFGPDDNDALGLLKKFIPIQFVTGDKSGFEISKKRISEDMRYPLELVSTIQRLEWIKKRWNPSQVVYMGDGIFDHLVFRAVGYSIAPANACATAKQYANFVTKKSGGDRAVAEACLHLLEKYFVAFDPEKNLEPGFIASGSWAV